MIFVCNTGPLIALAKLDRLALLQHLGGTGVFIPPMVYKELWGKIGPEAPLIETALHTVVHLAFRTLFWNSEAILPEFLKRGEAERATDAFIPHNHLFLYALPLHHNFLQLGRPIAAPLG